MDDVIVLRPEWLLDHPPAPPRQGMEVLIKDGAVECIREAGGNAVNLPGATLMPGLIDAHVHLTLCGCGTPRQSMMQESNEMLLLRAAANTRTALLAGITTLRDCGDRDGVTFILRDAIERGIVPGPRLLLSGPPLTSPRGHCYFMGGEVEGHESIARRVGQMVARGANFIKVMATGGGMTPGTDSLALQFSADELAFIVSEAAKHGLPVAAHAHSAAAMVACVEARVRTIEHASFADDVSLAQIASRNAVVVPTNIPAVIAVREGRTLGLAREVGLTSEAFLERRAAILEDCARHAVRVIAGSDAGATRVPFDSLLGEIELFAAGPYSNLDAIATATSAAAEALGLDRTGRIAPGYIADLLAVSGNPAEDISALRRPVLVMRGGAIIRQETP